MKKIVISLLLGSLLAYGAEPLSLNDCLKLAMSQNQDLKIGDKQLQSAREDIRSSYSGMLPSISLTSSATHSAQGPSEYVYKNTTFTGGDTTTNYFSTALSIDQTIYSGNKVRNSIKLAKNTVENYQIELNRTQQSIVENVTEKFYTVLKAQELLKVYEMTLKNSQEQLKKTEEMFKIGQVAKKDLFKAQVREGNDRLSIIQQKSVLNNALADLKVAIGVAPDFDMNVYEGAYQKPVTLEKDLAENKAVENNAEMKSLRLQKANSYLNYKIAKGDLLPAVYGSFSYSRGGSEIARNFSEFDKWWNTSLSLNISYPIFEGFSRKANIQQKKIAFNLYDDQIEKKKLEIISQVENLILTINTYLEMIDVNEINIQSAQEDLRLAQEMYRLNSATILDVLDAQVALTKAQGDLITTKYDAKIAEVRLAYLMGTLNKPE
jgi:TolC family type I secretion outer membrane protein